MPDESIENLTNEDTSAGGAKQVPVTEAIKYRRRAQQAESRAQQLEQQLEGAHADMDRHNEDLAQAEALRDEAVTQLTVTENRLGAERIFNAAGVIDYETASMLLSKRLDFAEELDAEKLSAGVEQLLLDKPFLSAAGAAALPPTSASARMPNASSAGQLAAAAQQAAQSGDRKDVAAYLRLRRQAATA